MKIQGTLTVEGIKLFVRVDVPDDQQEVYVTNVHPSCMVIPKDRWKIEYLGLSPATIQTLHQRDVKVLGQLVDANWTLGVDGLDDETRADINEALKRFLKIALVVDLPPRYELEQLFAPRPKATAPAATPESGNGKPAIDLDISVIGLLKRPENALRKKRGVNTIGDLLKLGRNRLVMMEEMDDRSMQKIEAALVGHGLELSDDPQTPSASMPASVE